MTFEGLKIPNNLKCGYIYKRETNTSEEKEAEE
jgi:hypothetical protein